jgi:hypothetical protein
VEWIKYQAEVALIWFVRGSSPKEPPCPSLCEITQTMTEYDYSPEAYDRFMATQTRISNWIDNVSQSMHTPSPSSRHSYDHHHPPPPPPQQYQQPQRHTRPTTYSQPYPQQYPQQQQHQHQQTHSNTHSQTHSRTNSLSRRSSRTRHQQHYQQEPPRPRSHSQTGAPRPQVVHSHTAPPPPPPQLHSRTYSYAMNGPPPPGPIPVPQPISYPHLAPRRSRTLPPQQTQNVVYQTYDAPRGGPTYVMIPPGNGVGPHGQQFRMQMQSPMAPTKRAQQPLLKRLFTSLGPWGSSSGASPKSKHAPPRRYPRRSSF